MTKKMSVFNKNNITNKKHVVIRRYKML